ncbi:MAG: amidohydrolase family protein [Pseudoalteromonas sp.]|uniref:amidohydrolase family protein n=1 Tax=unclassified Pseudoalteromonas TaxID=194690 RepID=UPI003F996337
MKKHIVAISVLAFSLTGCSSVSDNANSAHYTMSDYYSVNKIDAHVHANSTSAAFIEQAQKDNIKLLSINVDYPDFPSIDKQASIAELFSKKYPHNFYFVTTFSMQGADTPQWKNNVIKRIDSAVDKGAKAVKVWKNIGMDFKNQKQNLVMIDDPIFDPIFNHLTNKNIPLIGHQGEPKNCWLPVSKMTVNNDKQYFAAHPQYHMYLHPEMPSYEQQMQVRNNMLNKHPDMHFMGAHLASLEWSVDEIALFLDTYPNTVVDLAARMGQIQYQSKLDRQKVREFFIKYQTRILYATDLTHDPDAVDMQLKKETHKKWTEDWLYLNTDKSLSVPEVDGDIVGLALPKSVIDNLYANNAIRFFNISEN